MNSQVYNISKLIKLHTLNIYSVLYANIPQKSSLSKKKCTLYVHSWLPRQHWLNIHSIHPFFHKKFTEYILTCWGSSREQRIECLLVWKLKSCPSIQSLSISGYSSNYILSFTLEAKFSNGPEIFLWCSSHSTYLRLYHFAWFTRANVLPYEVITELSSCRNNKSLYLLKLVAHLPWNTTAGAPIWLSAGRQRDLTS